MSQSDMVQKIDETRDYRALILDDDEVDIMRLRKMCSRAGMVMSIDEAQSIDAMKILLDQNSYDLVFIDFHLGFDTGFDALRVLTTHPDQVGAMPIMVTSVTGHQTAIDAMRSGCADYLVKEELSVASLRKSIASGIERRILLSSASEARVFQKSLQRTVRRFSNSCGPEMRALISEMLPRIIQAKTNADLPDDLRTSLTAVERGAKDMVVLLDDLATFAIETGTDRALTV